MGTVFNQSVIDLVICWCGEYKPTYLYSNYENAGLSSVLCVMKCEITAL